MDVNSWRFGAKVAGWAADARPVVYPFIGSRLILLTIGLLTQILIQPHADTGNSLRLTSHAALSIWGAWDTGWYLDIAGGGYAPSPMADGSVNWVFFPAYPLLSAGLATALHLPVFVVMVGLSNACFLTALFLVRRLTRAEFGDRAADLAVALICAAPGSYIFSSAYTESLFLLALTAALVLLRDGRWIAGGAAAAMATLTRSPGIGLLLPFAYWAGARLWGLARTAKAREAGSEALRMGVGAALPLLALAAFGLILYAKSGDPLAFVHAQEAWGRTPGNPLRHPLDFLLHPERLSDNDLVNIAFVYLSLALLVALAFMRKWPLVALAAFLVCAPLSTIVFSYHRYCLALLPLFMAAAQLLKDRPAAARTTLVMLGTLNGFMMVAWTLMLGSAA